MNYILAVVCGFVSGIVLSEVSLTDTTLFFFLILSSILFLYTLVCEQGMVRMIGFIVSLFFLGIFLGQFRVLAFNHFVSHDLDKFETHTVSLGAKIISEPISNGETQKFFVSISEVNEEENLFSADGKVLVTTELFPVYRYGDEVIITGVLKKPEKIKEADGRVFDYPKYLLKDGVTHTLSFGLVHSTGKNYGNPILRFLFGLKEKFVRSIQSVLPEPEAGLLSGIVLGTQTLSKNISDEFRTAGLSHIVVLSGYNITIVAESVLALTLFVLPLYAVYIALGIVCLFVLLSGGGASVIRAGIMTVIALLGKQFGKTYNAGRALSVAGLIMIIWNPLTLLYDPGFHLSFLATIALIYIVPHVSKALVSVKDIFGLKEIFATTLSVNIFVLPYILYMSGSVQLFALPANMLVLPFVPLTMFLGLLIGMCGFVGTVLGYIPGIPAYIILYYDLFISHTVSRLSFSHIHFSHFSLPFLVLVYGIFFYFLYKKNHTPHSRGLSEEVVTIVTSDGYTVIR